MAARILALVPLSATLDEAIQLMEEDQTGTKAHIANLSAVHRSRIRTHLLLEGLSEDVVLGLVPKMKTGRRSHAANVGAWSQLSTPARAAIASALEEKELPLEPAWWTPEKAKIAAEAITNYYVKSSHSQAVALIKLRKILRELQTNEETTAATYMPEITNEHNNQGELGRLKLQDEGINVPEEYWPFTKLADRIEEYARRGDELRVNGQLAADVLVAFSARPGELETLDFGPNGGIVGMLKKRGSEKEMPYLGVIPREQAVKFLNQWRNASSTTKKLAMNELQALMRRWGLQKRQLRAIGAYLAPVAHGAKNAGQERQIRLAALRHAPAKRAAAVDYYSKVNNPRAIEKSSDEKISNQDSSPALLVESIE